MIEGREVGLRVYRLRFSRTAELRALGSYGVRGLGLIGLFRSWGAQGLWVSAAFFYGGFSKLGSLLWSPTYQSRTHLGTPEPDGSLENYW